MTTSQGSINYSYKVQIINPAKKSDVMVRHMNNFTGKFDTVMALYLKLIEAFSDHVPNTVDFSVGYYEGSQQYFPHCTRAGALTGLLSCYQGYCRYFEGKSSVDSIAAL